MDPSLQDRRRALKRARLLDGLNDKLFHRPGPLELVQGNILHADEKLAEAVKGEQMCNPLVLYTGVYWIFKRLLNSI